MLAATALTVMIASSASLQLLCLMLLLVLSSLLSVTSILRRKGNIYRGGVWGRGEGYPLQSQEGLVYIRMLPFAFPHLDPLKLAREGEAECEEG